ncbi:flagellar hook-associated protein 1 FlgK [Alkalispirochaeta americana]|uniref:Flagellar hook-associated protein 1 n=1 Tax=Alkalispirochaeta americana TaxID=159291 RepID=A0A1N6WGI2_9SPIO|nr:flagellar hook-associated protein FlgK [Alkalispirochaeta americana]SIQ89223.1 flagellar hook-associated protein 1 FlgK [Alkalispirochaeta americana]
MQSTFSGLELGKRGIMAHQRALQTVGHNLTNASTEGYSRQRVEFTPTHPLYRPGLNRAETPGQIGQGVDIARVERVRDELLDRRIITALGDESYWTTRERYVLQLEQVYNEPGDSSVRSLMDRFWDGWQELSLYPDQRASREAVLQRGEALVEGVRLRYQNLDRIRTMVEEEIRGGVKQINTLISDISDLNKEIVRVRAAGDSPNDLLDRRDLLVDRLSEHLDITVDERNPDEFSVYTAGYHIVQGRIARPFDLEPNRQNNGYSEVVWEHSGEAIRFRGGSLGALQELRDRDLREEIQALDTLVVNVADLVNEIHREGYGVNGRSGVDFFVEHPAVLDAQGNIDINQDGELDHSYIFRLSGANSLDGKAQIGLAGTLRLSASSGAAPGGIIEVPYRARDTVEDVIARINNSGAEVTARLNRTGQLELKGTVAADRDTPDFVLRHLEDSGQFLTGYSGLLNESGPAGAFVWNQADAVLGLRGENSLGASPSYSVAPLQNPSGWIAVNPEVQREPLSVASSFSVAGEPGEIGDGRAALAIAQIRNTPVGIGREETLDDYFADSVARVGLKGERAEISLRTSERIRKDLTDLRQSISGVNLDEELAQMIKFQHGYQAAARFITTVDRMLDTIINRLGS